MCVVAENIVDTTEASAVLTVHGLCCCLNERLTLYTL